MSSNDQPTRAAAAGKRRGIAADELRRHNLATVLERLHLLGPRSRSELTTMSGLNRSTIADLIGELASLGLVEERPAIAAPRPGRPSPVVQVRPAGSVALAFEVAVDSVAAATVGLAGHVFRRQRVARPRGHVSPEAVVGDLVELGRPLLEALPVGHGFAGIGVAVAGITRRSDGTVRFAPNLGWRDAPLGAMVAAAFGRDAPPLVANEADVGALGEHRRGAHSGARDLIYIQGEVGIGAGIISDGKPLLGRAGYAGEAGHMKVNPDGRACQCGGTGCLETEAGEMALLRLLGTGRTISGLAAVEAIERRAAAGDATVLRAIEQVGRWLGLGIGNLVNLFNPEVVVLGGLYHRLFPFLEAATTEAASRAALAAPGEGARIVPSSLGIDASLIGAAEAVLLDVIADPAAHRASSVA